MAIGPDGPTMDCAERIVVGPLGSDARGTKLGFAADRLVPAMIHRRWDGDTPTSITTLSEPPPDVEEVAGPVLYAGPFFDHFGHFVAESLHRLWPRVHMPSLAGARLAYHGYGRGDRLPDYAVEALSLCGVRPEELIRIDRYLSFETLFVPMQARLMSGPTVLGSYRDTFERFASAGTASDGGAGPIYVSRINHHHTGSIHGEAYLQELLAASGFRIVIPEDLSVREMVHLLRSARTAVFVEGSAIHLLELCGSRAPATFVIGRRPQAGKRFGRLLAAVTDRWRICEAITAMVGLSANEKQHSGIVDLARILAELAAFVGIGDIAFDSGSYDRAIVADLRRLHGDRGDPPPRDFTARVERALLAHGGSGAIAAAPSPLLAWASTIAGSDDLR